jgi:chaperonin GroES
MFNPIDDRIILKKLDPADTTSGGVILPDTSQEGTLTGEVIAVGPGLWNINGTRNTMQCEVGNHIVYPKFGAKLIEVENEEFYVIKEQEVLSIIKENK